MNSHRFSLVDTVIIIIILGFLQNSILCLLEGGANVSHKYQYSP
jgi:hypothetical protein